MGGPQAAVRRRVRLTVPWQAAAMFANRVTELLGIEIPIVQAPMGYIARSPLASAVSNAGGDGDHRDVVG